MVEIARKWTGTLEWVLNYRWLKLGQILLRGFGPLQPAVICILITRGQHIPGENFLDLPWSLWNWPDTRYASTSFKYEHSELHRRRKHVDYSHKISRFSYHNIGEILYEHTFQKTKNQNESFCNCRHVSRANYLMPNCTPRFEPWRQTHDLRASGSSPSQIQVSDMQIGIGTNQHKQYECSFVIPGIFQGNMDVLWRQET